jgi:hypothetical protein
MIGVAAVHTVYVATGEVPMQHYFTEGPRV